RLYAQWSLFVNDRRGQAVAFDLDEFLKRAPRQSAELAVEIAVEQRLPARLLCLPVAEAVAAARPRRVREDARRPRGTPSQKVLNRCDWTLLLTNVEAQRWALEAVAVVYRVRWQVELVFKLAKSEVGLEQSAARQGERVESEFYAKLLALVWFNRLT